MKYKEFMIELQQYYGIYENDVVKHDVYEYVKVKYYQSELYSLLRNIKKHFSRKWKVKPDIAIIVETEKKYPIIHYLQGQRQVPGCEKQARIEEDQEEKITQMIWVKCGKRQKKN